MKSNLSFLSIMTTSLKRSRLGDRIDRDGIEMFPCTNCEKHNRSCVVAEGSNSKRCGECVRRGVKCDVEGIPVRDWETLEREEERLRLEKEITLQAVQAGLARMARLEKQQDHLKRRGAEMLRRGLKTLDELEAQEEKEKQEREVAEQSARGMMQVAAISNDPPVFFSAEELAALGLSFDGTLPASQGS